MLHVSCGVAIILLHALFLSHVYRYKHQARLRIGSANVVSSPYLSIYICLRLSAPSIVSVCVFVSKDKIPISLNSSYIAASAALRRQYNKLRNQKANICVFLNELRHSRTNTSSSHEIFQQVHGAHDDSISYSFINSTSSVYTYDTDTSPGTRE